MVEACDDFIWKMFTAPTLTWWELQGSGWGLVMTSSGNDLNLNEFGWRKLLHGCFRALAGKLVQFNEKCYQKFRKIVPGRDMKPVHQNDSSKKSLNFWKHLSLKSDKFSRERSTIAGMIIRCSKFRVQTHWRRHVPGLDWTTGVLWWCVWLYTSLYQTVRNAWLTCFSALTNPPG